MKYNLVIRPFDEEFEPYFEIEEDENLYFNEDIVNITLNFPLNTKIEDAFSKEKFINMLKEELDSLSEERQNEKFLEEGIDIEKLGEDFKDDEVYISLKNLLEYQKK